MMTRDKAMIDSLFSLLKQIAFSIWNANPSFFTIVMSIVVIMVFIGTFLSNHYFRWRCFKHNIAIKNVAIEVEDTVFGLKMKPVPLKNKALQKIKRCNK